MKNELMVNGFSAVSKKEMLEVDGGAVIDTVLVAGYIAIGVMLGHEVGKFLSKIKWW